LVIIRVMNDESSKLFWNVGQHLQDYTVQHFRTQTFSLDSTCHTTTFRYKIKRNVCCSFWSGKKIGEFKSITLVQTRNVVICVLPNVVRILKRRRLTWVEHVTGVAEKELTQNFVEETCWKSPLGRPRKRWEENVSRILGILWWGSVMNGTVSGSYPMAVIWISGVEPYPLYIITTLLY
jgi:hypothetical protein